MMRFPITLAVLALYASLIFYRDGHGCRQEGE
jgi:hypothetical protein